MSEFNQDDPDEPDNKVGYKKPPKKHQYKPGQSGNPKGRPPAKLLYMVLQDLMSKEMKVKDPDIKVSYIEGVFISLLQKASTGDYGAVKNLITLLLSIQRSQLEAHAPFSYNPEDLNQDEDDEEDW